MKAEKQMPNKQSFDVPKYSEEVEEVVNDGGTIVGLRVLFPIDAAGVQRVTEKGAQPYKIHFKGPISTDDAIDGYKASNGTLYEFRGLAILSHGAKKVAAVDRAYKFASKDDMKLFLTQDEPTKALFMQADEEEKEDLLSIWREG